MKLKQTPPIASDVMKIKELEQTVASQEKTLAETEAQTRILVEENRLLKEKNLASRSEREKHSDVPSHRFSTLTNLRRK